MAYLGSTQLSSVANPPIKVWGGMGAGVDVRITGGTTMYVSGTGKGLNFGQQGWVYHTTDISSAPLASGYFTDAKVLGMRPGDIIHVVQQATSVPSSQMLRIMVIGTVTSDGAALSTATFISGTS